MCRVAGYIEVKTAWHRLMAEKKNTGAEIRTGVLCVSLT